MTTLRIIGRSSSHFTRCVRIFAHELDVAYTLVPIHDMLSCNSTDYAGNPALKMPILDSDQGAWFGALNICRELARRAGRESAIIWPEALSDRLAANAQELTLQGMATQVALVMNTVGSSPTTPGRPYDIKTRASLNNSLTWLDENLAAVLSQLREDRWLSYFEVTLFCFIKHLEFRSVLDTTALPRLQTFSQAFAQRASARATEYRFD